jgi:hypothetical protein
MVIALAIAAAEIGFWALVLGGLAARYVLHRRSLSTVLLLLVPAVDVLLLAVTTIDLATGGDAGWSHGLAAVYLGFSVFLGPPLIRSLDRRFAGRPAPPVDEWALWLRVVAASALAAVLLALLMLIGNTTALAGWFGQLGAITVIWLLAGPIWSEVTRSGSRAPRSTAAPRDRARECEGAAGP